jgi:Mrp family chromosome partitioning ATPase
MSYGDDPHKPKIVGVTSCNEGAGVTRLATGMAAALSRDADRNVLLIALSKGRVAVSAFSKGRPADGIAGGAPEAADSKGADLQKNLYSLVTTGKNVAGASIVQSFSDLIPRLKVSDYDFIVFDLPPLTQTSGSIRLASQMERTLVVVEAEKTSKDKLKRAKALLSRSKTQFAAVLNKGRSYGPKSLHDDV